MEKLFLLLIILSLGSSQANSQTIDLKPGPDLERSRDTAARMQLSRALGGFLQQSLQANRDNKFVRKADLLETSALLDEIKDAAGQVGRYRPYLLNVVQESPAEYFIQLAFMGMRDSMPVLHASFDLLAYKAGQRFYFSSPLRRNTQSWKKQIIGLNRIYYKFHLDSVQAAAYFGKIAEFDHKLGARPIPTEFYCADNFPEVLQLLGINYRAGFNGMLHNSETSSENDSLLDVNGNMGSGFAKFDPHDLWHERLHNVLSVEKINRPVDEGTACLYGGSWGMSWFEILKMFKQYAQANPGADWLALYNESRNFNPKGTYSLKVDFLINALIVQKLENEKGFPAVLELLACGKKQAGNENYFTSLQKLTGISRSNFNSRVSALIAAN